MDTHRRRPIRLIRFDYTQQGAYLVTMCTRNRACLFGKIVNGEMRLNDIGKVVHRVLEEIPTHFPEVETDAWIVMPNHVHGVVVIADPRAEATHASPLQPPRMGATYPQGDTTRLSTQSIDVLDTHLAPSHHGVI